MVFIWPDLKALYVVSISIQPLPSNVRLSSSANENFKSFKQSLTDLHMNVFRMNHHQIYKVSDKFMRSHKPLFGWCTATRSKKGTMFFGGSKYEPTKSVSLTAFLWQNSSKWWFQSTPLKNIIYNSQIGNLPQIGMKIPKKIELPASHQIQSTSKTHPTKTPVNSVNSHPLWWIRSASSLGFLLTNAVET